MTPTDLWAEAGAGVALAVLTIQMIWPNPTTGALSLVVGVVIFLCAGLA